jgi:hypothetical protein
MRHVESSATAAPRLRGCQHLITLERLATVSRCSFVPVQIQLGGEVKRTLYTRDGAACNASEVGACTALYEMALKFHFCLDGKREIEYARQRSIVVRVRGIIFASCLPRENWGSFLTV